MKVIDYNEVDMNLFSYTPVEDLKIVREILDAVKTRGNEAVREYSLMFDGLDLERYEVSREEIQKAYHDVEPEVLDALRDAADNVRAFAEAQFLQFRDLGVERDGVRLGQRIVPLEKVGCYVPGGRYPLPSSAIMSVIPAKMAGVKQVVVCSPKIQPVTIVAADIAGADKIFNIGGVQAIGAMAYGTETVPAVDKIIGPGNVFVNAAKKEVNGLVGIDFIAGPSEVMVIADETGDEKFIVADLLAQAEHDPKAGVYVVTTSTELADRIQKEMEAQLSDLSTKDIAAQSVAKGLIVMVDSIPHAIEFANKAAPEHLEIQVKDPDSIYRDLLNYGSLFIGKNAAEALGDYCSGTNHILPTNRAARYTGGLSVRDFVKVLTYQEVKPEAKERLCKTAAILARVEGLEAHARAAEKRLDS